MNAPSLGFFVKVLVLDRAASAAFYETLGFVRVGADARSRTCAGKSAAT